MNWDESKACTSIKRDFLRAWFEVDQRFFLTGGSSLGLFYLHHRISYDLDLFTTCEVETIEVRNLVMRVANKIGAECQAIRSALFRESGASHTTTGLFLAAGVAYP